MSELKSPQEEWDSALMLALRCYEASNFRKWNEEDSMRRFFTHQETHVAVKFIARMILDYKSNQSPF